MFDENVQIPNIEENRETTLPIFGPDVNLPDESIIEGFKKKYPGYDIYAIPIAGQTWIFRDIHRDEYYKLRSQTGPGTTPEQFEEKIAKLCTLYPEAVDFGTGKAGVPTILSDLIFLASGFEPGAPPVKL